MKKTRTAADVVAQAREADQEARRLEALAAEVHAKVQKMEAESVDALVSNPDAAADIGAQIDAQARLERAYREKAAHHRREVDRFKLEALAVDAAERLADAEKLEADADKHAAKVEALLSQLEDLDGVAYEVAPSEYGVDGRATSWGTPKAAVMQDDAHALRVLAAHSLYYSRQGETADTVHQLRETVGEDWLPRNADPFTLTNPQLYPENRSELLASVVAGTWLEGESV